VKRHLSDALEKGATVAFSGGGVDKTKTLQEQEEMIKKGTFFPPTLLTGCSTDMACFQVKRLQRLKMNQVFYYQALILEGLEIF
jgi:hypothetical protein